MRQSAHSHNRHGSPTQTANQSGGLRFVVDWRATWPMVTKHQPQQGFDGETAWAGTRVDRTPAGGPGSKPGLWPVVWSPEEGPPTRDRVLTDRMVLQDVWVRGVSGARTFAARVRGQVAQEARDQPRHAAVLTDRIERRLPSGYRASRRGFVSLSRRGCMAPRRFAPTSVKHFVEKILSDWRLVLTRF
jgi:hypothetical protein